MISKLFNKWVSTGSLIYLSLLMLVIAYILAKTVNTEWSWIFVIAMLFFVNTLGVMSFVWNETERRKEKRRLEYTPELIFCEASLYMRGGALQRGLPPSRRARQRPSTEPASVGAGPRACPPRAEAGQPRGVAPT